MKRRNSQYLPGKRLLTSAPLTAIPMTDPPTGVFAGAMAGATVEKLRADQAAELTSVVVVLERERELTPLRVSLGEAAWVSLQDL